MTHAEWISSIEERTRAATPGPWYVDEEDVRHDCSPESTDMGFDCTIGICVVNRLNSKLDGFANDREFIAHSRTDIELLLKCHKVMWEALNKYCSITAKVKMEDGKFYDIESSLTPAGIAMKQVKEMIGGD